MHPGFSLTMLWIVGVGATSACGRTSPIDAETSGERLRVPDAGLGCIENADCDEDSICADGVCRFFGECILQDHCSPGQRCIDHVCSGEVVFEGGPPILCEINSDCPEGLYCVDERCRVAVECQSHAHCTAGDACVRVRCVSGT